MAKTVRKNLIRRDNTNNVTYVMKIYDDNTYVYCTCFKTRFIL